MTPEDRIAAEMAAASYIHNEEQLKIFVNEVSHIGKAGYTIDEHLTKMSDGLMVVYHRKGKATYSFRGTEEWIGPDGLANLTNPSGFNILAQALHKATGVDLRPEQQKTIFKVLEAGVNGYQTPEGQFVEGYGTPEGYNGHSRGGAEAKLARLRYGGGIATVFDTSPGGRAVQQNKGVRSWAAETDIVSALDRMKLAATNRGDKKIVKSTTGFDPLGSHDMKTFLGNVHVEESKLRVINNNSDTYRAQIRNELRVSSGSFTKFMKKQGIKDISSINNDDPIKQVWQEEYDKLYSGDSFNDYRKQFPAFSDEEQVSFNTTKPDEEDNDTYRARIREEIKSALNSKDDSFTSFMKKQGVDDISTVDNDWWIKNTWQEEYDKLYSGDSFNKYREQFPAFSESEQDLITGERTVNVNGKNFNLPKPNINDELLGINSLELERPVMGPKTMASLELAKSTFGPKGMAGLGLGLGLSQALSAAGLNDPVSNTLISGAGAGAGAEGLDLASKGVRNILAENIPKIAGIKSATEFTGEALLKGMTRGAGEGLLAGMAGLPVDMLLNRVLTQHSGGAGMSHSAAGAISGGSSGAFSALSMGLLAAAAGEASTGLLPLAVATLLFAGIGSGLGAIFGKMDDDKIQADKETIERQTRFLTDLQNNSFDMSKTDKSGLEDDFIQSVQNALDGKLEAQDEPISDDEIEKQRQAALDTADKHAKYTHGSMRTLTKAYQRINKRFDDMKKSNDLQSEFSEATNVYVNAKLSSIIQLSLQEDARQKGQDTFTFNGKEMSTSGDYSFKPDSLDIDTDRLSDIDPNWQSRMDQISQFSYATNRYQANEAQSTYSQILQYRIDNPDSSGLPDSLTENQRNVLNRFYPDIETNLQTSLQPVMEQREAVSNLNKLAKALSLSPDDFVNYAQSVQDGADPDEERLKIITTRSRESGYADPQDYIDDQQNQNDENKQKELQNANELGLSNDQYVKFYAQYQEDGGFEKAGYLNFQDYLDDFKDDTHNALTQEDDDAADYTEAQNIVEQDGFYTLDEYKYYDNMTEWTPQISQILRAHGLGLTLQQFNNYMEDKSHGIHGMQAFTPQGGEQVKMNELDFVRKYRPDGTKYSQQDIDDMNSLDYQHLQTDLTASGNNANAYNADFTQNKQAEVKHNNPNLPTTGGVVFSDEQIEALDAGGSVYNENDHSVYASA